LSAGAFFLLTLYLQQARGHSPWATGLLLLPMTLAIMPASVLAGRCTGRFGPRRPLLIGYLLTGASIAALAAMSTNVDYLPIGALFVACGIGQGLAIVPAPAAVLQVVARERSGVGSAMVSAARQIGTALGFAVLGTILNAHLHATRSGPHAFAAGVRTSLLVGGGAILVAAAALALLPRWSGRAAASAQYAKPSASAGS
jgi:MFS family permease